MNQTVEELRELVAAQVRTISELELAHSNTRIEKSHIRSQLDERTLECSYLRRTIEEMQGRIGALILAKTEAEARVAQLADLHVMQSAAAPAAPVVTVDTLEFRKALRMYREVQNGDDEGNFLRIIYCADAHTAAAIAQALEVAQDVLTKITAQRDALRGQLMIERVAKDHAIQQAQQHAMEARTQRGTVLDILRHFDCPEEDWHALELIKATKASASVAAMPDWRARLYAAMDAEFALHCGSERDADGQRMGMRDDDTQVGVEFAMRWVDKNVLAAPQQHAQAAQFPPRDTSKPAEQQGIFEKFRVQRTDGSDAPGGKHHGCKYFVIDLDHDQYARAAMRAYAAACRATHPLLADDIEAEWGGARLP